MKKYVLIFLFIILFNSFAHANMDFKLTTTMDRLPEQKFDLSSERENFIIPEFYVKGIYVTGWVAGQEEKMNDLIKLVENTILNTMVIDVKDQQGFISYDSSVNLVNEIGAVRGKIKNIRSLMKKFNRNGIYTIARIVVFKDTLLASKRKDFSLPIWNTQKQILYYSGKWVDPSNKKVWKYNVDIAREAAKLGFDEIQFDYVRYPAMTRGPERVVLNRDVSKTSYIAGFLKYAVDELSDLNIPISADVFGLTTTVKDDLGIGQNFDQLTDIINIISPMVYPSHYSAGSYGIEIPASQPFEIIYRSLRDAQVRSKNKDLNIRPWLQDFSLKHKYTYHEVMEQIKAVESLNIDEWLLWNPSSRYTEEALNQK